MPENLQAEREEMGLVRSRPDEECADAAAITNGGSSSNEDCDPLLSGAPPTTGREAFMLGNPDEEDDHPPTLTLSWDKIRYAMESFHGKFGVSHASVSRQISFGHDLGFQLFLLLLFSSTMILALFSPAIVTPGMVTMSKNRRRLGRSARLDRR